MKMEELKGKSNEELRAQITDIKKELLNLRFQKASGELASTARFKEARKEIARILTAINSNNKTAA
jgi:large subunit ribosomal protein L29